MDATPNPRENLRRLIALWEHTTFERQRLRDLRRLVNGDQRSQTRPLGDETPAHFVKRPRINPNLAGALFDELSYLYAIEPTREVARAIAWKRILWGYEHGLSAMLSEADRDCRVGGGCCVLVQPSASMPPGTEGRVDDGLALQLYSADRVVYLTHPEDRRWPGAVLLQWGVTEGGAPIWQYWDAKVMGLVKSVNDTLKEHGLGGMPAVLLSNTVRESPMGSPSGGIDLFENLLAVNQLMERVDWAAILKPGQPVIARMPTKEARNVARSPDAAIEVEVPTQDYVIAQDGSDLDMMLRVIQSKWDAIAMGMGLAPGAIRLIGGDKPGDVRAVIAHQVYLQRDRVRRERVARRWEQLIHQTASVVWESVAKERLPSSVEVTYSRLPQPLTHEEAIAQAVFERDSGLADKATLLRMVEPHLTAAEAAARIEAADEERRIEVERQVAIAGHAGDIAPQDTALIANETQNQNTLDNATDTA